LAATTFLVTAGSQPPEPPEVPHLMCYDLDSGETLISRTGHCAPRVQVEVPVRPGSG
jgi:hypothetical protein